MRTVALVQRCFPNVQVIDYTYDLWDMLWTRRLGLRIETPLPGSLGIITVMKTVRLQEQGAAPSLCAWDPPDGYELRIHLSIACRWNLGLEDNFDRIAIPQLSGISNAVRRINFVDSAVSLQTLCDTACVKALESLDLLESIAVRIPKRLSLPDFTAFAKLYGSRLKELQMHCYDACGFNRSNMNITDLAELYPLIGLYMPHLRRLFVPVRIPDVVDDGSTLG